MAFKTIFIIVIICAIQLPGSFSKRSEIFTKYYEERDEFGDVFCLYGFYPKLANHTRYYRIPYCYNSFATKYENAVKHFVQGVEDITKILDYEESTRPLHNLIKTLKTYPTNLERLVKLGQYDEAKRLVYETTRRVIYFDIWYQILTDRVENALYIGNYPENIFNFFHGIKSNYLELRKKAKQDGWDISIELINCITTLIAYLKPVNELRPK